MRVMEHGRTIGALAEAAVVHVETVRYYERRGLIARPRSRGSWRRYDADALRTLRFVKRAQELGFSLEEVRGLLALRSSASTRTCARVRARAEEKLAEVDAKIRDLLAIRGVLETLTRACRSDGPAGSCPILGALASNADGEKRRARCCAADRAGELVRSSRPADRKPGGPFNVVDSSPMSTTAVIEVEAYVVAPPPVEVAAAPPSHRQSEIANGHAVLSNARGAMRRGV